MRPASTYEMALSLDSYFLVAMLKGLLLALLLLGTTTLPFHTTLHQMIAKPCVEYSSRPNHTPVNEELLTTLLGFLLAPKDVPTSVTHSQLLTPVVLTGLSTVP